MHARLRLSRRARYDTPCRCHHGRAAHEHYRRGTDCALCGAQQCRRYRPDRLRAVRRVMAPPVPLAALTRAPDESAPRRGLRRLWALRARASRQ